MNWLCTISTLAVVAATLVAVPARADEALAQKHGCLACHSVDKKSVGPSYKEIASKYKGQNAQVKLEEKVKKGGTGVWGPVPMAPNPNVPDGDVKKLVAWIVSM